MDSCWLKIQKKIQMAIKKQKRSFFTEDYKNINVFGG